MIGAMNARCHERRPGEGHGPNVVSPPAWQFSINFAPDSFAEHALCRSGLALPRSVERAVPKRRAEFIAGRYCARRAIRAIVPGTTGYVDQAPDRSPVWPAGVVGSITHTASFASAAAASAAQVRSLGIDSETIMSRALASSLRSTVAARGDVVASEIDLSEEAAATLLFSAKESVFKCLYPLVRRFFGFEDVCVEVLPSPAGTFRATLLSHLGAEFSNGVRLWGRYELEPTRVHTGVMIMPGGAS